MENSYIAYYRVSTAKQGASGLGLQAQKALVARFVADRRAKLVGEYEEVVSGQSDGRLGLSAALKACERHNAALVIAKLDRLSRRVSFVARILDSNVRFVVADMPQADRMTLQMMAVVAERERALISERTKAALHAAKLRGRRLGNPGIHLCRQAAADARSARADQFARELHRVVQAIYKDSTYAKAADDLNRLGVSTLNGGKWHPTTVRNLLLRVERMVA